MPNKFPLQIMHMEKCNTNLPNNIPPGPSVLRHLPKTKTPRITTRGKKWKTQPMNKQTENLLCFNQLINYFNQIHKTNIVVFGFNDIKVLC